MECPTNVTDGMTDGIQYEAPACIDHSDIRKKKVIGMLYLLIRDHMPFGELSQMLRQNIDPITQDIVYTNEHILAAAEDLFERYIAK